LLNAQNILNFVCSLGCGETSNTTDGFFTSPSYPNVYNISTECTYTISLPTNASITIYFETFELDRSDNDNVTESANLPYLLFSLGYRKQTNNTGKLLLLFFNLRYLRNEL